ncbi:MAG: ABC transporter substrate-binding protein, partial [Lentisphaeria bacterium]|nr:ABC transporter substrate-binding protein [Lentisphaeria bacterium]
SLLLLAATLATAAPAPPDAVVREATDRVLKMVMDPEFRGDERRAERRAGMIQVVDQLFDWQLMAQLAMGRHWRGLTAEQQAEFVPVFKELIVSSYLGHVESYEGEKIAYQPGVVDMDKGRGEVKAVVSTNVRGDVDILYRLYLKGEEWQVRDVVVIGVSLVSNYRTQLNDLMHRQNFQEVMDLLRKRIAEQRGNGEKAPL